MRFESRFGHNVSAAQMRFDLPLWTKLQKVWTAACDYLRGVNSDAR
ncbi:MAG: hypothetical protein JWO93_2314 [Micrococcaceae bacterium]|nr:hypothetical protein [Micrococcaceae bacterium]